MRSIQWVGGLCLLMAGVVALPARAGTRPGSTASYVATSEEWRAPSLDKGVIELRAWGGGAVTATTALGGLTPGEASLRKTLVLGLRYGRVVAASGDLAFEYVADLIPVEIAFRSIVAAPTGPARADVYGAGFRPLGFALSRRVGQIRHFVGSTGGIVAFTDVVPLPGTRKLDFTADFEAGISITRPSGHALVAGATLHHISNWKREPQPRSQLLRGVRGTLVDSQAAARRALIRRAAAPPAGLDRPLLGVRSSLSRLSCWAGRTRAVRSSSRTRCSAASRHSTSPGHASHRTPRG